MAEFKRDLEWVERLDVTLGPVPAIRGPQATSQNKDQKAVDPEDDFQREMSLYVCFQMWQRLWVLVLERGKPWARINVTHIDELLNYPMALIKEYTLCWYQT